MSYRTELTSQDKKKILAYIENFNPAQIARKIGCDPTTIRRIIDRYKKTEKTENLPRSEHPPTLDDNEKNPYNSKRALYNFGIYSHIAAKKLFISEKHSLAHESSVDISKQSQQLRV
ncbi:16034_t:CDS:2 [Funneliformis caledonium]|uniref:16034_t:CDS:1 n=1 Tax=Funneliformis caledonium TaxID=1117310 RepID=A0A9N9HJM0_9GLOM|nr:16034_t:CDS:2 [Funneliformis caledonium]